MRTTLVRAGLIVRQRQGYNDIVLPNQSVGPDQLTSDVGTIPVGMGGDFYGPAAPYGFLQCDGAAISRALYAKLFAVIGTYFGVGDGSTTFNLPDSRGRSTMGAGTGPSLSMRALGDKFGEENHTLSVAEVPALSGGGTTNTENQAHNHNLGFSLSANGNHGDDFNGNYYVVGGSGQNSGNEQQAHNHNFSFSTNGGGGAHNNIHPSLVVTKVIRYI